MRGRHLPPPSYHCDLQRDEGGRAASCVDAWQAGDPFARSAKREKQKDAANVPRSRNISNRRALRRPIRESAKFYNTK